jgi:hypothetical protein
MDGDSRASATALRAWRRLSDWRKRKRKRKRKRYGYEYDVLIFHHLFSFHFFGLL